MNKERFKLIEGGLLDSIYSDKNEFIFGYITNTRLMGVLTMHIKWKLPSQEETKYLHQFFYFDAEEFGFEGYAKVLGDDEKEIAEVKNAMFGGLGGMEIAVTRREAEYLVQKYADFNSKTNYPMPSAFEEYSFLLKNKADLTDSEKYQLMIKECTEINSSYELVNYFLMRCFGKDFYAAGFLAKEGVNTDLFPEFSIATLCKNTVDKSTEDDTYICESLVDVDTAYYVTITSLTVNNRFVSGYERLSSFKVSPAEAAMMLARSEFVSVFEILGNPQEFSVSSTKLCEKSMETEHESGRLYMMFHQNNKHVDRKLYRLNEDVFGMYFISNNGQLISAAYSIRESRQLEIDLGTSPFGKKLIPIAKYEFQEPVLYEFVQSDFDDFEDFVDAIKTGED